MGLELSPLRGEPCTRNTYRRRVCMGRMARLSFSVFVVSVLLLATAGVSSAKDAGTTYMKVKSAHGAKPSRGGSLLFSLARNVEVGPKAFIVHWGAGRHA